MENNRFTGRVSYVAPILISVAIFFLSMFVMPMRLLAPLPLFFGFAWSGYLAGSGMTVAATAIVFLLGGSFQSLIFFLSCGVISFTMADAYHRDISLPLGVIYSAAISFLVICLSFFYFASSKGASPIDILATWATEGVRLLQELSRHGGMDENTVAFIEQNKVAIAVDLAIVSPSLLFAIVVATVLANVAVIRVFSERFGWGVSLGGRPFAEWRLPDAFLWMVTAGGLGWFFSSGGATMVIAINLFFFGVIIYLIAGLSIFHHFLLKWKTPVFVRALGYFVIAAQPFIMLFIAGIGFFDVWADFRKINHAADEKNGV